MVSRPRRWAAAGALLAALLGAGPLRAAKPLPAPPGDYVHNEGALASDVESALGARLAALERRTGRRMLVAVFRGLEGEHLDSYAGALSRRWKVDGGGLLFCLFVEERLWRIGPGTELEPVLSESQAAEIGRRYGEPLLKLGDSSGAVRSVVEQLARVLEGSAPAPPRRPRPSRALLLLGLAAALALGPLIMIARAQSGTAGNDW